MKPIVTSLITCRATWCDPIHGDWTLLGIFNAIKGSSFPLPFPPITVFLAASSGHGAYKFRLILRDCGDMQELMAVESVTNFESPHDDSAVARPLPAFAFVHPGTYQFVVEFDGEECATKTFSVTYL